MLLCFLLHRLQTARQGSVTPSIPSRVDYEVTDLGRSLFDPLGILSQWAIERRQEIEAARTAFDARA